MFTPEIIDHLETAGKIVGSLTAIAGFGFAVWKYIIKPIVKHFETVAKIDEIYKEVKPNGGSSIKDGIQRLEDTILSVDEKITIIQETQDAFREDGPVGVFECSVEGENSYVNRTYAKWLGASKSDLMGFGWKNYLASFSLKEDYDNEWKQAFQEGREVQFPIAFKKASTGEKFFCDIHAYPITNQEGVVEKYLGILYKEKEKSSLLTA